MVLHDWNSLQWLLCGCPSFFFSCLSALRYGGDLVSRYSLFFAGLCFAPLASSSQFTLGPGPLVIHRWDDIGTALVSPPQGLWEVDCEFVTWNQYSVFFCRDREAGEANAPEKQIRGPLFHVSNSHCP